MKTHTVEQHKCAEPGCKQPGRIQVEGNRAWFCFAHKPVGRVKS